MQTGVKLASDKQKKYMETLGYVFSSQEEKDNITSIEASDWIGAHSNKGSDVPQQAPQPQQLQETYIPNTPVEVKQQEQQVVLSASQEESRQLNLIFKLATMYASSTIVPDQYRNNQSNCFIALQMAKRMGADPFQVMQSLNIIKGRPSWSSAFIIASINQSRRFKTAINYRLTGSWKNQDLSCVAFAYGHDGTLYESVEVTYQMAKAEGWIDKSNSKWQTMPELMIRYRAASFFGKQYCPDLLLGLMTTEEQKDIIDVEYAEVTNERRYDNTADVNEAQRNAVSTEEVDNDLSSLDLD